MYGDGDANLPREVLPLLAETREQPEKEREREQKKLKKDLNTLSKRIKPSPGPDIPDHVWTEACEGDRKEWPLLNDEESDALEEMSDYDLHPKEMMLTMGEYLSTSLSTPEQALGWHLVQGHRQQEFSFGHDSSSTPCQPHF